MLSKKNGYKLSPDSYLCKIVFVDGRISYHLFEKLSFAKKYSESITKKFSRVSYCEVLPFGFPGDFISCEVSDE